MSDKSNESYGAVFFLITSLLGIAFIFLKLCGVIAWSWIWVTAPFWGWIFGLLALVAVPYALAMIVYGIKAYSLIAKLSKEFGENYHEVAKSCGWNWHDLSASWIEPSYDCD